VLALKATLYLLLPPLEHGNNCKMVFLVDYFQHRRDWYASAELAKGTRANAIMDSKRKQRERDLRIATLPAPYLGPLSAQDKTIHSKSIEELVQDVHKNVFKPVDILRAYGKVAVRAQEKTNCLTEIMIAEAEGWAENEINLKGIHNNI
jgi:hypothetical protein